MIEKIKDIVKKNDLCILATVSNGEPHCSLMSYVPDDECHEIYMISYRSTKKYSNLVTNRSVSLLIDTREEDKDDRRANIKALTIKGEFQKIFDQMKKDLICSKLLEKHPHLIDFVNDPDAEVFSIKIESFQLLDGLKDSFFEKVE